MATTVARLHASGLLPMGIRERRYVRSPFPATLHQLRARIADAVAQVDVNVLRWIWDEIAYR
jgi:hypothetical protein